MFYYKKILYVIIFCVFILENFSIYSMGQSNTSKNASGNVNITFTYKHLGGFASNQYAVWIEDANGKYIKTLLITRFTARGGWKSRPDSVPVWAKVSGVADMSSDQIDSITGATPGSGGLTYTWDCTDISGKPVPAGEYKYFVEGTLRWKNRVVYAGTIKIGGGSNKSTASSEFFGDSDKDREMITGVVGEYLP